MDSNVVRVNILGQEYVMKTSANPQYIKDVAKYVNDKKSMSFRMKFQSNERTLKDEEVDNLMNLIADKLTKFFNAVQR
jgi:phenylalanyl-tRNA synthetase beta subunit